MLEDTVVEKSSWMWSNVMSQAAGVCLIGNVKLFASGYLTFCRAGRSRDNVTWNVHSESFICQSQQKIRSYGINVTGRWECSLQ